MMIIEINGWQKKLRGFNLTTIDLPDRSFTFQREWQTYR